MISAHTLAVLVQKAFVPMTDDPTTEARKSALRKFKQMRGVPWLGFFGLFFFSVNVLTAIEAGTVQYAGRFTHAMTISYQDHPALYIFIVSFSVVAVPFFAGMLYTYYFKRVPD
jgi:hypothetical protein